MKIVILNVKHNQQISFIWNQIGLEIGNSKNQKKYSSDGKLRGIKTGYWDVVLDIFICSVFKEVVGGKLVSVSVTSMIAI